MKRMTKSILGVTLLEIMLVLAIAAMVIVMSVRYYQSANVNQQSNSFVAQLSAMQAAADSLAQGTGTYTGITSGSIVAITGGGTSGTTTPWGTTISITAAATTMTYTVSGTTPTGICKLVRTRLMSNTKWTVSATCATFTYTMTN